MDYNTLTRILLCVWTTVWSILWSYLDSFISPKTMAFIYNCC